VQQTSRLSDLGVRTGCPKQNRPKIPNKGRAKQLSMNKSERESACLLPGFAISLAPVLP
jgi:hypothetical protein